MNKKKHRKSGKGLSKLTRIQAETLRLLTEEFLTINKVAIRRGVSIKAIYQTIAQLKKKGVLGKGFKSIEKNQSTIQDKGRYRLHGLEFNIKILHLSEAYKNIKKKVNHVLIDGNTIRLYNNSIEVYCSKSFYADSVQGATSDSNKYINRLFLRLENDFKIILVKDRSHNIKIVNAHYSEINNGLARECNIKKEMIKVYSDQGKLWFLIDNSFNLHEAETIDPLRSKNDMERVVAPFFNDLRDNEPVTMGEVKKLIFALAKENHETAQGLNSLVQFMKSQLNVNEKKEDPIKIKRSIPDYVG